MQVFTDVCTGGLAFPSGPPKNSAALPNERLTRGGNPGGMATTRAIVASHLLCQDGNAFLLLPTFPANKSKSKNHLSKQGARVPEKQQIENMNHQHKTNYSEPKTKTRMKLHTPRPNIVQERFLPDPCNRRKAVDRLFQITQTLLRRDRVRVEPMSQAECSSLQCLLAAVLVEVRKRNICHSPDFLGSRYPTREEERLLDEAAARLNLRGCWQDHKWTAETSQGPVIVSEPYQLISSDFEDFVALAGAGWEVSVKDGYSRHFPGETVCVLLRPPTAEPPVDGSLNEASASHVSFAGSYEANQE